MPRAFIPFQIIIQIENPVTGLQAEGSTILSGFSTIVDEEGKIVGQTTNNQIAMAEEDVKDDLLQVIQKRFADLGLEVTRKEPQA